jgi:hypothetical protein
VSGISRGRGLVKLFISSATADFWSFRNMDSFELHELIAFSAGILVDGAIWVSAPTSDMVKWWQSYIPELVEYLGNWLDTKRKNT